MSPFIKSLLFWKNLGRGALVPGLRLTLTLTETTSISNTFIWESSTLPCAVASNAGLFGGARISFLKMAAWEATRAPGG